MRHAQFGGTAVLLFAAALGGCARPTPPEEARVLLSRPVAAPDAAHEQVSVVEVTYSPGGGSAPHRHTCPVFGYVVAGVLRSRVQGEQVRTYQAGEAFYEAPDDVHVVSVNASRREPTRFLAVFVCDHTGPRTLPIPDVGGGR